MGFAGGESIPFVGLDQRRGVQQRIGQLRGQVAGRMGVGNQRWRHARGTLAKGVLSRKAARAAADTRGNGTVFILRESVFDTST
jgi:hypothetical protein